MAARPNPQARVQAAYKKGHAAYMARKHAEAIRPLQVSAQSSDPRIRGMSLKMLGHCMHRVGRDEDALNLLRQAESFVKADPEIPMMQALALRQLERTDEAIDACKRALKVHPHNPNATTMMIEMLVRLRRDEEAERLIAEADAHGIFDHYIDIAYSILAMRTGRHEEAAARLRRHEGSTVGTVRSRSDTLYALGNALDAGGRHDEAWGAYERANAMREEPWNADTNRNMVASIKRAWTPDAVRKFRVAAVEDERPLLVVGMPRSGTTLVEMTLGAHPRIQAAGELRALSESGKVIGRQVSSTKSMTFDDIDPAEVHEAAKIYSQTLDQVGGGKDRVVDKMPMNVMLLGYFAAVFPKGTIIHVRRDPRDTCLSCFFRNFEFPNPWSHKVSWLKRFYEGYCELVEHWGDVLSQVEGGPLIHEVKYEDLVQNREEEARKLVAAARVEWDDACLDVGKQKGDVRTLRPDQVGKSVYTSSLARHELYAKHIDEWQGLREPTIMRG